jgi:tripartite-type tricarboxylate transporter receptor subunit TctC
LAHIIADKLGTHLGKLVQVENRAGGGGVVGSMEVVRSAPDGYTLGLATSSTVGTNPAINPAIPYSPVTDLTPIINLAATPNVIAVHPSFPARTFPQFLRELRRHPGKYAYASSGPGGVAHLQMELFKSLTATFILHIPYRGSGPALADSAGGQVPIIFDNVPSALPFTREGNLVPIVVASPQRLTIWPDVPTFKEVGLESCNRMAHYGLVGPKGVPRDVVDKVHEAARKTLDESVVRKRIAESGALIVGSGPEQFAEQIKTELASYKDLVVSRRLSID